MANEKEWLDSVSNVYGSHDGKLDERLVNVFTLDLVAAEASAARRVLLMGVGSGVVARELQQRCAHLTVVEGSAMLAGAFRAEHPGITVVETLFEDYTPEEPFDLVIGSHVLEHVEEPVAVAARARAWMAPGALAIFTVPNRHSLHRRVGVEMGLLERPDSLSERDHRQGHRRVYDGAGLKRDIQAAGYRDVEVSGYWAKFVPNTMMADWSRELVDAIYRVSRSLDPDLCVNLCARCRC
ncbi:class I SAM-dependent methyltransferase [Azospirillum isscasi]|uniref:Class I SAM-dependent methyltransferase n=1 Tax=Azospirillum isscasi TaxID=3053926 RepID=A0ABU0WQY8_9PROT|nr:class I SAM-dependent methyltransferase [Azospirillum isscasi]MDQ2106666.1 class I SAM-dependent methyltransferase [Azospirillum isscasi]